MGLSWLDGLIALVVVLLILWEVRRDLGQSLFDTIALLFGLRLAIWLGPWLAGHLGCANPAQAHGIALILLFVAGTGASLGLGYYLNALTRWTLDTFDRVAGLLLGFSSAVIVCHVLALGLSLLCATKAGPPPFVTQSRLGQEALSFHTFREVIDFFDRLHRWA